MEDPSAGRVSHRWKWRGSLETQVPTTFEGVLKRPEISTESEIVTGERDLGKRIYALAKELKLDSKELVDICTRAGIPGKGSALASLTDEEVGRIQAYLQEGPPRKRQEPEKSAVGGNSGVSVVLSRPSSPQSEAVPTQQSAPESGLTQQTPPPETPPPETPPPETPAAVSTSSPVSPSPTPVPPLQPSVLEESASSDNAAETASPTKPAQQPPTADATVAASGSTSPAPSPDSTDQTLAEVPGSEQPTQQGATGDVQKAEGLSGPSAASVSSPSKAEGKVVVTEESQPEVSGSSSAVSTATSQAVAPLTAREGSAPQDSAPQDSAPQDSEQVAAAAEASAESASSQDALKGTPAESAPAERTLAGSGSDGSDSTQPPAPAVSATDSQKADGPQRPVRTSSASPQRPSDGRRSTRGSGKMLDLKAAAKSKEDASKSQTSTPRGDVKSKDAVRGGPTRPPAEKASVEAPRSERPAAGPGRSSPLSSRLSGKIAEKASGASVSKASPADTSSGQVTPGPASKSSPQAAPSVPQALGQETSGQQASSQQVKGQEAKGQAAAGRMVSASTTAEKPTPAQGSAEKPQSEESKPKSPPAEATAGQGQPDASAGSPDQDRSEPGVTKTQPSQQHSGDAEPAAAGETSKLAEPASGGDSSAGPDRPRSMTPPPRPAPTRPAGRPGGGSPLGGRVSGRMVDLSGRKKDGGGTKSEAGTGDSNRRRGGGGSDSNRGLFGAMQRLAKRPEPPAPKPKTPEKTEQAAPQPKIKLTREQLEQARGRKGGINEALEKIERQHVGGDSQQSSDQSEGKKPRGRRGGQTTTEEETSPALDDRNARLQKRKKKKRVRRDDDSSDSTPGGRSPGERYTRARTLQRRSRGVSTAAARKSDVLLELPITVRAFCEAIGIPSSQALKKLMSLNILATINSTLEDETTVSLLASELGVEVQVRPPVDIEDEYLSDFEEVEDEEEDLHVRPPIVTFLGHVDHGKTSLLDKIIERDVAGGESGGITQHIRAYNVPYEDSSVTFVDTPGHEAFTAMRARGAKVTDIAVLVVAADDGIMPQTEEAISHARAADVPIVVALNKIDLPGVNVERVYQQLAQHELMPSEWGGDVEVVKTSALTGEGLDELMSVLLTLAEIHELRANPDRVATGTCLEAELQEGRGVIAKMLVQNGTLRPGDPIVCGTTFGRARAMFDCLQSRETLSEAGPGVPVNLTGLDEPPAAGEPFYVLADITQARELIESRREAAREAEAKPSQRANSLEDFSLRLAEQERSTLNLIIRADTRGSLEAITKELTKLEHPEVQVRVLQKLVGGITEADVHLADVTESVILGFNVVPDDRARTLARDKNVQIRRYQVIYELTNDVKEALEKKLKPGQQHVELGQAVVLQLFHISRLGTIAGCRVARGTIERNCRLKVIRDNRIIGDYGLDTLRREKDDVRSVRAGYECGIKIADFNDVKEGDILEAYKIEEVARTLDDQ